MLTAGKHRCQRLGRASAGDMRKPTEKEREISFFGGKQIEALLNALDWCLGREAQFRAETGGDVGTEPFRISGQHSFGVPGGVARVLRQ